MHAPVSPRPTRNLQAASASLNKPVILVGNKAETRAVVPGLAEAYGLGFGEPLAISAEHAEGLDGLYEALQPHRDGQAE